VDVYSALADPVRRTLLGQLAVGPARVVDLAAAHRISRPAISRHLRMLTEAGLVAGKTRGRERHYRLEPSALAPMADFVTELAELAGTTRPAPPISERHLDALELEVRRTGRQRTQEPDATSQTHHTEETA
jgi:DNA-binding transcriptional ArsR family regulator